jgi:hypothetical protein
MVVALRRSLGNTASHSFGSVVCDDISGQTVRQAEIECAAALNCSMKGFHSGGEARLRNAIKSGAEGLMVAVHSFASDATNSSAWKSTKLQGLHLESSYICSAASVQTGADFAAASISKSAWADTLPVGDGTGRGCHAMIEKQFTSLGCPLWGLAGVGGEDEWGSRGPHDRVLRIFADTSDGGPDQMKFNKIASACGMADPAEIWIFASCHFHTGHLIAKSGLALVDRALKRHGAKWLLFSSLAQVAHTWRDDPAAVHAEFSRLFRGSVADQLGG